MHQASECDQAHRSPLPFQAPSLDLVAKAHEVIKSTPRQLALGNDMSVVNMYLFAAKYGTMIAVEDGIFYRHYENNKRFLGYGFPYGTQNEEELKHALGRIECDAAARQRPVKFCLMTAEEKDMLMKLQPERYAYETNRSDSDYIYARHTLAELPGGLYHKKRNRVSAALRELEKRGVSWEAVELDPETQGEEILALARSWQLDHGGDSANTALELSYIEQALKHWKTLKLQGLVILVEGEVRSFAICSYSRDAELNTHFEKTHPDWRFLYPLINRECAQHFSEAQFINREEDLGSEGLRKAKLSYHPQLILDKYSATQHANLGA